MPQLTYSSGAVTPSDSMLIRPVDDHRPTATRGKGGVGAMNLYVPILVLGAIAAAFAVFSAMLASVRSSTGRVRINAGSASGVAGLGLWADSNAFRALCT